MITCSNCQTPNRSTARFCAKCGHALVAVPAGPATLSPGRIMHNRYRLLRPLSKGGMGAIYLVADQDAFDKSRVIKEMLDYVDPADYTTPAEYQNAVQKARQRFEEEGRTLAALKHRGIPEIIAYFAENNSNYIVMEYVEGADLEQRLTHENSQGQIVPGRAYPTEEVIGYGIQVCKVLEYLSTFNPPVIHQDIKPANLILDKSGEVRLVDFGTARAKMVAQPGGRVGLQKSSIYGTAGYAPPEQYQAKSEPRSDVYALAATLYHLITDDDPRSHPFSFPQLPTLPQAVWDILGAALQQDVQHRPPAKQFRAGLESLLAPKSSQSSIHLRGGGIAHTISELAQVCHQHWEDGKYHLYRGDFEPLLRGWGRNDLEAKTTNIRQTITNQDMGLDGFLRQLDPLYPSPRLQFLTGRLDCGPIAWQEKGQLKLELQNGGGGCLSGRIVQMPPWVEAKTVDFSTHERATIPLTINTANLSPNPQPHTGHLLIEAGTGGQGQLPVTVFVPEPQLEGFPATVDFGSAFQGERLNRQLTLNNQGQSGCQVQLNSPAGWLTISPTSFRLGAGKAQKIGLVANTATMSLGAQTTTLTMTATAGNQWQQTATSQLYLTLPWFRTFWHRYKVPATIAILLFFIAAGLAFWQRQRYTHYQAGMAYRANEQWEEAIAEFEQAGSFEDAETQLLVTHYQAGLSYQANEQWEEAIAQFEQAGSYEDVQQQLGITIVLQYGGTYKLSSDGMVQVYVPAGTFDMGRNGGYSDEQPEHSVYLDSYYIDQTEVTNEMYAACVTAGVCKPPARNSSNSHDSYYDNPTYANYPVIWISWEDANAFCQWRGASLPTEAQWEKAARGTEGRIYPWGDQSPSCDLLNYGGCVGDTSEVGSYAEGASPYVALDMAGNVWEWVADWYDSSYYDNSPAENPAGPADGTYKVLRGGSWSSNDGGVRAAYRGSNDPTNRDGDIGLRCAQE